MAAFRVRDKQINFRCTEEERRMIGERYAASNCSSLEDYIRQMAMRGYVIHVDFEELKHLIYEINKIGTNINQIAHHVNSDHTVYEQDMQKIQTDMDHIWQLLRQHLFHLENSIVNTH